MNGLVFKITRRGLLAGLAVRPPVRALQVHEGLSSMEYSQ